MEKDLSKNKNIVLGDVDLNDSYLDPKNQKLRITTYIDVDLYNELQKRAQNGEGGGKYQPLLNKMLRLALFPETEVMEVAREEVVESIWNFLKNKEKTIKSKPKTKTKTKTREAILIGRQHKGSRAIMTQSRSAQGTRRK